MRDQQIESPVTYPFHYPNSTLGSSPTVLAPCALCRLTLHDVGKNLVGYITGHSDPAHMARNDTNEFWFCCPSLSDQVIPSEGTGSTKILIANRTGASKATPSPSECSSRRPPFTRCSSWWAPIVNLAGNEKITAPHVAKALQYCGIAPVAKRGATRPAREGSSFGCCVERSAAPRGRTYPVCRTYVMKGSVRYSCVNAHPFDIDHG
jgi:hypothetical protein